MIAFIFQMLSLTYFIKTLMLFKQIISQQAAVDFSVILFARIQSSSKQQSKSSAPQLLFFPLSVHACNAFLRQIEACTQPVVLTRSTCTTALRLPNKASRYPTMFLTHWLVFKQPKTEDQLVTCWAAKLITPPDCSSKQSYSFKVQ